VTPCSPCLEAKLRRSTLRRGKESFRALQGFRRSLRPHFSVARSVGVPGCPGAGFRRCVLLRVAQTRGNPGVGSLRVAPMRPTRVARDRAFPGTVPRLATLHAVPVSLRSGPPEGGLPNRRRTFGRARTGPEAGGLVGLHPDRLRRELPLDPGDPASGRARILVGNRALALVCFVVLDPSRSRGQVSTSREVPCRGSLRVTVSRCVLRLPKSAPSRSCVPRSPRPASVSPPSLRRTAASRPRVPPSWFDHLGGSPPRPCSGVAPSSRRGVRDVSALRRASPSRGSCPSKP